MKQMIAKQNDIIEKQGSMIEDIQKRLNALETKQVTNSFHDKRSTNSMSQRFHCEFWILIFL